MNLEKLEPKVINDLVDVLVRLPVKFEHRKGYLEINDWVVFRLSIIPTIKKCFRQGHMAV